MINSATHAHQILSLMHKLVEYRQQRIHGELYNVGTKYSMLHLDVLTLLYHLAKNEPGAILEIGASLGGATIAMALGVANSGGTRKLISIEHGGKQEHPHLGTKDIIRDLRRNLTKENVSRFVTLINGHSSEEATIADVRRALDPDQIGLLVIDADGAIERDINCFKDLLADDCWVVIDDYYGPAENIKVSPTRRAVDDLVTREALTPLGYYGWGTWIGSWRTRH
jgi:predicted O-methyltransferase YrrM